MPKPKLTDEALKGKAPLRTLSELAAFFAARTEPAKEEKPKEPPPAVPESAAAPETPPAAPSHPEGHAG